MAMAGGMQGGGAPRGRVWRAAPWAAAAAILLLPAVAMQVTDEVAWDAADFAAAAILLLGACGAWEVARRMAGTGAYRAAIGLAIVGSVVLVWINLAVGLIGSEDDPANLIFAGVLAIGILGAVVARFRPPGMARALAGMAVAQVLTGAIALTAGWGSAAATWPGAVVGLTAIFAALWLASAWLFRRAAP
jgi:hypothetical protein